MSSSTATHKCSGARAGTGFTLIEVLVVVAIIALLIAILLPTLRAAKEQSRSTVCLSNLKQQGVALNTYAMDNKNRLPWVGSFRFSLMEGLYYIYGQNHPERHNWGQVNLGLLFPKYVGNNMLMFYCPGNRFVDAEGPNGTERFRKCLKSPRRGDPGYEDAHNFPISPWSAYAYAVPAAPGTSPRNEGNNVYPEEVVRANPFTGQKWPYWDYLQDSSNPDLKFLGSSSPQARGKHNVHALVSDTFFRKDYYGYHLKGHNVLYSDYHARRVTDPNSRIYDANLSAVRATLYNEGQTKVFQVWDYFSRNP